MSDLEKLLSLAALLSFCEFKAVASSMETTYLSFGFPLFLLPSIFLNIIVFPVSPVFLKLDI